MNRSARILVGDVRALLPTLPDASVQCCVTSPPYWGLRDYGTARWEGGDPACAHGIARATISRRHEATSGLEGSTSTQAESAAARYAITKTCACGARRVDQQIGMEPTPQEYVATMVDVFREIRRVLRDDGTLWLNLGDSYCARPRGNRPTGPSSSTLTNPKRQDRVAPKHAPTDRVFDGLKFKDLVGVPWRVAFALQADGWWLRQDNIWHKPSPMPESVQDRTTRAHEYVFHLAKSDRYLYDVNAIREPFADERQGRDGGKQESERNRGGRADGLTKPNGIDPSANGGRNKRSVWTIPGQPYDEAHFAVMPEKLVEPCILAGTRGGGYGV